MKGVLFEDINLNVELYPDFLSQEESKELYDVIIKTLVIEDKMKMSKRINFTFGDDGVDYKVTFGSNTIKRVARPWKECPLLKKYRDRLINLTRSKTGYNYVVVQIYPSGKVGINPHRDKEMKQGTDICGISLGATRDLVLTPSYYPEKEGSTPLIIPLKSGSLYILNPPTNESRGWLHSIPKSAEKDARISLTYRYIDL